MSILGMGPLEIVVVALIAFIVLGPDRMVDAARFLGRMVGEGRRLASEMPRVVVEDDDIKVVNAGETISMTRGVDRKPAETVSDDLQSEGRAEGDGPVAFTPASEVASQNSDTDQSPERENTP
ncbi:MAG: twin-arginine translocase TatA/TatE family subunit [Dehalococcoidia bacterium]|nr:twin-arginine translocase TatA/TatE family subunit [Dehalococcoidia bacterium]